MKGLFFKVGYYNDTVIFLGSLFLWFIEHFCQLAGWLLAS